MKKLTRMLVVVLSCIALNALAAENWQQWRDQLRTDALAQGIAPEVFDEAFRGIEPVKRVVKFDRAQPEDQLTFKKYRDTRVDAYRIHLGVKKYKKYRATLEQIGKKYGVDPYIITALWGIESSYGHFKGNFPVVASLATLAYDGRRSDFFRNELLHALHIINDKHISLSEFKGAAQGASGHAQFLPSSWTQYAVDHNGDGQKDIWNNLSDAFASIGNYLKSYGWEAGQPWGLQVTVPNDFDRRAFSTLQMLPVSQWRKRGVKPAKGQRFPQQDYKADLVEMYGGQVFMVFHNYYVLKKYNQSGFYAASVGYLADRIRAKVEN